MNIDVTSADYRAGNSPVNHPIKVNGVYKVGDVTFKRGLLAPPTSTSGSTPSGPATTPCCAPSTSCSRTRPTTAL